MKTVKLSCLCNSLTDFDEIWHDDAHSSLTADRPLKFRIFENPRPGKYTTRVDPHVDNSQTSLKLILPSTAELRHFCLLIRHVTLTFDLLTLNSWRTWRVTWLTLPPSWNTLCLSVLDLWVITFPFGYHWECVRGHCACAESRDPWVGGQKQLRFWNPRPRFAYSLYNFFWATTTIKGRLLSSGTNAKALHCVNFLFVTLWPWPLTFWSLTYTTHGGHVINPATKFEDPTTILSWVTSYNSWADKCQ